MMRLSKDAIEALGLSKMFETPKEVEVKKINFSHLIRLINLFAQFNGDELLQILNQDNEQRYRS